ncbi:alpha/beta hydrolase [Rhizobium alvei]|uniref:Alpha/beta fold hydrolase n=1 Tax=Rhizobium alvei TaxID=1132659 RepID=A0ABT8YI09_9HYPH|nr:alpha/beta fold hydrolase [Rhizobium alvei]MDO6963201.1 alpha/beta fold hydrolase [Rhizobium alvei]
MASYLFRLTGQALNLTGHVSPAAAGNLAFRLFSRTPGGKPTNHKEKALLAATRARMAEGIRADLPIGANRTVAAYRFAPLGTANGKTLLVVHGWGSRIAYLQTLITGLRQAGFAVVGLDLPGHGHSSGRNLTVPLALAGIRAAWDHLGPFDAVVGHSFGGFVSAMATALPEEYGKAIDPGRLVLIAAPATASSAFDHFGSMLGLKPKTRLALDHRVERITGRPTTFFDAARMLSSRGNLPVLVLHAEDDREVKADAARRYDRAGAHVTLRWTNGLGHRRIVQSQEVITAITDFLV